MSSMIEVWTDGACIPNPGFGGWAWVTKTGESNSGKENPSTNQRMEMWAVLDALQTFDGRASVIVINTDSQFVINGCTQWLPNWRKREWITKGRTPVKNLDLWLKIDAFLKQNQVFFKWVRGHSGDEMNERADLLACQATGLPVSQRIEFLSQFAKRRTRFRNNRSLRQK